MLYEYRYFLWENPPTGETRLAVLVLSLILFHSPPRDDEEELVVPLLDVIERGDVLYVITDDGEDNKRKSLS